MPYDINNEAAFSYLKAFQDIELPNDLKNYLGKDKQDYLRLIQHIANIKQLLSTDLDGSSDYLSLYTKLHELAQKINVKENPQTQLSDPLLTFHQQCFIALYENDNKLFHNINAKLIHDETNSEISRKEHIRQKLKEHKINSPGFFQFTHPENWANKLFSGLLGIDYNPLKRSNVPYVAFNDSQSPTLLRMGTQVQGMQTLQPAFANYLGAKKSTSDKETHHIYFNLLKRNMKNQGGKFERYFERAKTRALESINTKDMGAVVITLPADSAFFFEGYSKSRAKAVEPQRRFKLEDIQNELIQSIADNKNDFYIPDGIKEKLFKDSTNKIISDLYQESVDFVLGENKTNEVTAQQRQAILFDFVKFGLTNYIVKELNPDTMNISCKDAIDRGGVHALWYEFRRQMSQGKIMSEAEFNMHLDASALLVKGRPVNDHRNLIWNMLNESYMNNPKSYQNCPWVKQWLINNYPIESKVRALQAKQSLTAKEQALLDHHHEAVKAYKAAMPTIVAKSEPMSIPATINVTPQASTRVSMGYLHRMRDDLSPHLAPTPEQTLEQSHNRLESMHQFLTNSSNQAQLGISEVKRKGQTPEQQPEISFKMKVSERPVKVIAKPKENQDTLIYATRNHVPLEDFEAVAMALCKVVLQSAKPGCSLDFSVAPPEKRPILERVFKEAIAQGIKDGKYNDVTAPHIVTVTSPKIEPTKHTL